MVRCSDCCVLPKDPLAVKVAKHDPGSIPKNSTGGYVVGPKVFGKSLPRLETSQSTPPFLQLNFLVRLKMNEICCNSFNMIGRAFCGNGFIHLNIPEIHGDNIGGQKKCSPIADQGSK